MMYKMKLSFLLLLFLCCGIFSVASHQSSRVGSLGNKPGHQRDPNEPKESSMVLPAVLQVLQSMSDQVEELKGSVSKGRPKGGISGHRMPPYLLRLMVLRNSLITAAKKRKMSSFSGYSEDLMPLLVESSQGTAGHQLKMLLTEMLDRKELTPAEDENAVRELARTVLKDVENEKSDLNKALEPLKPVTYSVD